MEHPDEDCGYDGDVNRQENEVSSLYERRTSLPRAIQIDFSQASISSYYSSRYEPDDEVFIEFEEWQNNSYSKSQMSTDEGSTSGRMRRTSDVIDCLGVDDDLTSVRARRTTSPDLRESLQQFNNNASPLTPRSDVGYWSGSVTSVSSPFEPRWFRFSQSETQCTISRQGSVHSDAGPSGRVREDSSYSSSVVQELRLRHSTTGEEEVAGTIRKSDAVDAQPVPPLQPPTTPVRCEFEVKEATAPVERDSDVYNMGHAKRGVAVIMNHENFHNNLPFRDGSKQDVVSLDNLYKTLGFDVRIYKDLNYYGILDELSKLSKEDHHNHDCLIITILTHGLDGQHLYAYDVPYPLELLYDFFTAKNCLSLAGKPKVFIIQACRGRTFDSGVRMVSRTATDSSATTSYTIPNMSDFLIASSTYGGFYSFRNPEEGTWFIQSFVKVMLEQYDRVDLLSIMTKVACAVAVRFESFDDTRPDLCGLKQCPSLVSTLLRQIYFTPKNQHSNES